MSLPPPITAEQLASLPPEFQALMRAVIEYYEGRIAELESRLGKTPQNSSLPPSTQHPHAKPDRRSSGSRRSSGAVSRGTRSTSGRWFRPTSATTSKRSSRPSAGVAASGSAAAIPSRCGIRCGNFPRSSRTSPSTSGIGSACPSLRRNDLRGTARRRRDGHRPGRGWWRWSRCLMGCFRQSKRRTALFLEQILGQPCSPGWVVKLQNQATAAVRPAYDELVAALPAEPVVGMDETPTKEANGKAWLWTAAAERFTVFAVRPSREGTAVSALLGESFAGVVTCDRAKMYWQSRACNGAGPI